MVGKDALMALKAEGRCEMPMNSFSLTLYIQKLLNAGESCTYWLAVFMIFSCLTFNARSSSDMYLNFQNRKPVCSLLQEWCVSHCLQSVCVVRTCLDFLSHHAVYRGIEAVGSVTLYLLLLLTLFTVAMFLLVFLCKRKFTGIMKIKRKHSRNTCAILTASLHGTSQEAVRAATLC